MKATLPATPRPSSAKDYSNKERTIKVVALVGDRIRTLVEARMYMGRSSTASTVYAAFWVYGGDYIASAAKAGGGGYRKQSAALGSAIRAAGIELSSAISGVGEAAMQDALLAIAREVFPAAQHMTTI